MTEGNTDDLTYDQIYQIPLTVTFRDSDEGVKVAYAGCGSHEIEATGVIDLERAQKLYDYLRSLPGVETKEEE